MRPLIELSNAEKAKYIHQFLPGDMKAVIGCIENIAYYVLHNKETTIKEWTSKTITAEEWLQLAEKAIKIIDEFRPRLIADSQFFADQLFPAYMGIFSLHCIQQYINVSPNQRLLDGVKFFFDLKPEKQIPEYE